MTRTTRFALVAAMGITLAGCAGFDNNSVRRTGSGAGIGAATGAVIGAFSGSPGAGAAIGATVGAAGGYLFDQIKKEGGFE